MNTIHPQTLTARAAINCDSQHGAVMPPIQLSSNFSFAGLHQKRQYDYTRSGNPTRDQLAQALADLEQGHSCVITSTGMSAVTLILQLLQPEDLLLAPDDCYGGCQRLLKAKQAQGHLNLRLERFSDTEAIIAAILADRPRMVWIETPSNPLLRLTDIQAIATAAHQVGAWVVADNTFLTPLQQKPLLLGADIVMHSTTKYLNGHSDVVGGAVICADPELGEKLAWWGNCLGITGAPFDSWLTLRGLRTLPLRMQQHTQTASQVAQLLEQHPAIDQVYYPGLNAHPGHQLAQRQQSGFGGVLSFELNENHDLALFVENLKLFTLAESLGGVESLIAHPASMTHASMPAEDQLLAGIGPRLLRLSVGIEYASDLWADLEQALEQSQIQTSLVSVPVFAKV
jgi:cystathionine gamma-synthase